MRISSWSVALALAVSLSSGGSGPAVATIGRSKDAKIGPVAPQLKQLPPAPPSTPPPNRTRSGGSLGGDVVCAAGNQNLMALVPVENPVLTTAERPTLLFYVPFGAEQVAYGEFSVLIGPQETQRLYQTRFRLPAQPGIVSLTLPASSEALQENINYHWYFKLYCANLETNLETNPETNAEPQVMQVDGWIQRVALTPERQQQIASASPQIWYDALAQVAAGRLSQPQNSTLQSQWQLLLEQIGQAELVQKPLVGAVELE